MRKQEDSCRSWWRTWTDIATPVCSRHSSSASRLLSLMDQAMSFPVDDAPLHIVTKWVGHLRQNFDAMVSGCGKSGGFLDRIEQTFDWTAFEALLALQSRSRHRTLGALARGFCPRPPASLAVACSAPGSEDIRSDNPSSGEPKDEPSERRKLEKIAASLIPNPRRPRSIWLGISRRADKLVGSRRNCVRKGRGKSSMRCHKMKLAPASRRRHVRSRHAAHRRPFDGARCRALRTQPL